MTSLLIKNGRVINPGSGQDRVCDVRIEAGKITAIGTNLPAAKQEVDASGCYVMPGLVDIHVHLRDPGFTHKEDIESGAKAAARGGVTTMVAMPNTKPVVDSVSQVRYVYEKAEKVAPIHILQVAAITKNQNGTELADIKGLVEAGAAAISEDGKSVMDSGLYREAMKLAAELDIPVLAHCEDINLVEDGVVNADERTKALGLKGISNAVEDVIVARDILLAKETGARLHLCHCSTADSVDMVKTAKEEGLSVTAEVCPHHFILTTEDIKDTDTNYKMNPPIRTRQDVDALVKGLQLDIMDVIATDHAPHSAEEKNQSMEKAPFGIVGLETLVPLTITALVDKGILTPMQMAQKTSYNPAKILGIDKGTLTEGKSADIVIIDPNVEYRIDSEEFVSKGKNTPFHGYLVKGRVMMTICDGEIVYNFEK